ncbi:MAG: hypothetical protein H7Z41_16905 [Cytophagales bacterium]|nr:hypothetical protein [Armatimonadota bacterium]
MLYRRNHIHYRIADAFFRNWVPFLAAVAGVSGVVGTALVVRSASYVASSSIRVVSENEVSKVMGFSRQYWTSPAQQNASHFGDLMADILPGGFVDSALRSANLRQPIQVDPKVDDPQFAKLKKAIYAESQSTDVFTIGLVWKDREECEQIVKAFQQAYIEEAGRSRQSQAIATAQYLNSEIERYKANLQKAEQALTAYKIAHAGQLPNAQASEIQQFANLRMERDYLAITAQDNSLKRSALEQRIAMVKPTAILEQTVGNDPLVQQLRDLQGQRSREIVTGIFRADSAYIAGFDKKISQLKRQIATQQKQDPTQSRNVTETKLQDNPEFMDLMQQLTDAKIAQKTQTARVGLLNKQLAQYQTRIAALPAAERELTAKTRDYTILKEQYEDLLQRRQQAELKANMEKVTATSTLIVQNPIYAEETVGTQKKLLMVAGSIVLGIIIGLLMILLREWMDPSLRYETDAARLLGVPVLASLPESQDLRFPQESRRKTLLAGSSSSDRRLLLP